MKASLTLSLALCLSFISSFTFADDATKNEQKQSVRRAMLVAQQREQPAEESEDETAEEKQLTDRELYMQIRTLYATGKLDDAEAKLKEALEQYPDSAALKSLHQIAFMMLSRANRAEEAYAHQEAYVNDIMESASQNPARAEQFGSALGQLISAAASKGGDEQAMEVIDTYSTEAEESDALKSAVLTQKALYFGRSGKVEEAREIIAEQVAGAKAAFEASPEDANATKQLAGALKSRVTLESAIKDGEAQAAWDEFSNFLEQQAKANPENNAVALMFITENFQRASMMARSNPDAAEAALKKITEFQANEGADVQVPAYISQRLAQLEKSIADTRRRDALVGSDAVYPENVVAWVNGEERTPEDLKGKVVLLDFFAVWCGPCIATFPHLRDWHDQFHNDGLEIIALSNYQNYGWDDDSKRAVRGGEGFTSEEEHEAMQQFATHHELRHPIGFTKDRSLSEHYVVSGIPHVVLIDRQGKVRLFKIGSGEANAHAIEEAIKECLAE